MNFSFTKAIEILSRYWPSFWLGVRFTLTLAICGTLIGLVIGLVIGGLRTFKAEKRDSLLTKIGKGILQVFLTIYIEVFRGTPMMVQAIFIYYGFKPVFNWDPLVAGIAVISINTGAYMAEIIRAGIQSVDPGQKEAARCLGMSNFQAMLLIVIPQAIKNAFPAMGNEFIVNIKDSSVLNVISVTELFFQSSSIAGSIYRFPETFFITACIYFILTFTVSRILNAIEKRFYTTKTSLPASQTVNVALRSELKGDSSNANY